MAASLEEGLPSHLHRTIKETLKGKRDIFKPPPRKLAPTLSIPLTPADLDLESALVTCSGGGSLYGDGCRTSPLGDAHTSSGWKSIGSSTAATHRSSPSLLDSPPSGPSILGAARMVGNAWVRNQEREWYRGQLSKRAERVNAEAERLFLTTIGPLGMSMNIWRKVEDKVEGVAVRNVKREEALELHRLRLQEWGPQMLAKSATAAVRSAVAAARESSTVAGSIASAGSQVDPESPRPATSLRGEGRRRCMSAQPRRYMETNIERERIRKALDKLAAKHVTAKGTDALSAPSSPEATAAAGGAASPSAGCRSPVHQRAAAGTDQGNGSDDPAAPASPLQLLQNLRARREARWLKETHAMAARVSAFMEVESPASPRVAEAAPATANRGSATSRVALRSRGNGRTAADAPGPTISTLSIRPTSVHSTGTGMALVESAASFGRMASGGSFTAAARMSASGLSPVGSPLRQQHLMRQAEEQELAQLTPEKAALAVQLVNGYIDACRSYRLHAELAVCSALRRSCAAVPGEPRSYSLELTALTLTNRESAAALTEVLTLCTHVTAITLDRCAVGMEAMGVLIPALWGLPLKRLTTINTEFPPASWPLLQRALGRPTVWGAEATWWLSLRHLALTGNGLADQGLCALVEVLVAMPNLQSLALRQCGLSDLSAPRLERLLGEVTSLRDLDVGYNNLGAKALGALARGLHKATQIRRLSVAWNSVGGGVAQLCWTVMRLGPRHCHLQELDLAGTDLVAEDLFAIAAILRTWPKTTVRNINLSHNNLVGVAGQCLLRRMNYLMQPQLEAKNGEAASPEGDGGGSGPAAEPPPNVTGPPAAAGTSFRSAAEGGGGVVISSAGAGGATKALVPILKMPGAVTQGGARGESPVKRLTINPTPQAVALPPTPSSSVGVTPRGDSPSGRAISASPSGFHSNLEAAAGKAAAAGRSNSISARRSSGGSGAASTAAAESETVVVITTGCVVDPCLSPGAKLLVHPDGRPIAPTYCGDDDDHAAAAAAPPGYGGLTERDRQRLRERERERQRERERAREREREREERLGNGSISTFSNQTSVASSATPSIAADAAIAAAVAAAPVTVAHITWSVSRRLGAGPRRSRSQPADAPTAPGGEGTDVLVEPSGPHVLHLARLDLSQDMPDREVAALLVEHEVDARRHRYRSAFRGVKWQGEIYKREGVELVPLDPVFLGWTHSLPREGLLELLVAVLPAQLCAWLANPRLHFNAEQV